MQGDPYWKNFEGSGKVGDYLQFKSQDEKKDSADNKATEEASKEQRNKDEGTCRNL